MRQNSLRKQEPSFERADRCRLCGTRERPGAFLTAPGAHGARLVGDERFSLVRCLHCGIVYVDPRPGPGERGSYYRKGYYGGTGLKRTIEDALSRLSATRKRRLVERYRKGGRILDIGCGDGGFLWAFIGRKAWKAYGIEPSMEGYRLSKEKGVNVFRNELARCSFPERHFDAVTLWHVLEHSADPLKLLKEAGRVLDTKGILVLAIPNIKGMGFRLGGERWFHLDPPRHLFHFDRKTIRAALKAAGLNIVRESYPVLEYPLDLYHSVMNSFASRGLKTGLALPALALSLVAKPLLSLFRAGETMVIVCRRVKKDAC
ncbi:MAG TPA: class I SAM-dependent methyltransferase [Thermodesulfobacteriota bacterium]